MTPIPNSYEYPAFGGQVTFYVAAYLSPDVVITAEKIGKALPADDTLTDSEQIYRGDFQAMVSFTRDIVFALNEDATPALYALQRFWDVARVKPRDYLALYDLFLETYDTDKVRAEWTNAINSPMQTEYAAPLELATALPDEPSDLQVLSEQSPLPSKRGTPSTVPSSKSSRLNGKPRKNTTG
jgi:hypothetical protein